MKQLHRFLFAEQLSRDNPATSTSAAKPVAALPIVMTERVTRLLAQARSEAETAGRGQRLRALRLVCLVELLYATGLRVSELVGLKTSAVEKERDLLVVRGKGRARADGADLAARPQCAPALAQASGGQGITPVG